MNDNVTVCVQRCSTRIDHCVQWSLNHVNVFTQTNTCMYYIYINIIELGGRVDDDVVIAQSLHAIVACSVG